MLTNWIVLDVATAPLPDAETYLDGAVRAPSTYKDPEKIAAYIAEKQAERLQMAATDVDLARVTGIGMMTSVSGQLAGIELCEDIGPERGRLGWVAAHLARRPSIITFGGFNFDLPLLMRRARYLGVDFPTLNLDRYRSDHVDLCEVLSDRNPQRRRSLQFYAKRLGWTDISKPLSGAEEARVPETGKWDELAASLRHDVTATYRLAQWLGVIQPQPEMSAAAAEVGF